MLLIPILSIMVSGVFISIGDSSYVQAAATNFTVQDVDSGMEYSFTDFRGTVVVLDLFATWCSPCQLSVPFLGELHSTYSYDELRIISVDVDYRESQAEVSTFRQEENMNWIVSLDDGGFINSVYGTESIPTFYIFDQDGNIQWTENGFDPSSTGDEMRNTINYLLEEGPGPINTGGSDVGRIFIIIAEVIGGLGITVAAIYGYTKLRTRLKFKNCESCGLKSTSKCAKCGTYTCSNCSTKGCKNCGSRQFIRIQ